MENAGIIAIAEKKISGVILILVGSYLAISSFLFSGP